MKSLLTAFLLGCLLCLTAPASTVMVVPIFEPISLHGTDGDDVITDIGEALQASVMSRPMALTGAFPEALVDAIRSPHLLPGNQPNYKVKETNLLVICNIGITSHMTEQGLQVKLDISEMKIPPEIDLTPRQILKLAIVALRKTLEEYQHHQPKPLPVSLTIQEAEGEKSPLCDLDCKFTLGEKPRMD